MDKIQSCLATNIKRYRKQLHFSQEKLAEKAEASANYIAMIENGRYFPSLPMLRQIAGALNVDSLDLFDKAGFEFQNLENLRSEVIESVVKSVNAVFDREENI
ncbi:MAG: helix-turn-helix transcriptional regulator [Treponema sp.]|nr:helix-turn-helix transcriptional regulator [Treponema sp.]